MFYSSPLPVVLRFVIVPIATRLPAGTNLLVHYAGTATLLNPRALASGDPSKALESGAPIIIDRRTRVLSTLGNVAIVSDVITLHAGATSLPNTHPYAVNRSSLEATTAPSGQKVEPTSGLTVSFPIGPKPNNSYRYYDATTELTVYRWHSKGPHSRGPWHVQLRDHRQWAGQGQEPAAHAATVATEENARKSRPAIASQPAAVAGARNRHVARSRAADLHGEDAHHRPDGQDDGYRHPAAPRGCCSFSSPRLR